MGSRRANQAITREPRRSTAECNNLVTKSQALVDKPKLPSGYAMARVGTSQEQTGANGSKREQSGANVGGALDLENGVLINGVLIKKRCFGAGGYEAIDQIKARNNARRRSYLFS